MGAATTAGTRAFESLCRLTWKFMANQADLLLVLRDLAGLGQLRERPSTVAERLWPDARTQNANGQVFPLGAGVAGRMLRKCNAV